MDHNPKKMSIQDYYYNQRRIADKYEISDNHAGCYISHFPWWNECYKCPRVQDCEMIFEKETENE